MYPNHFIYVNGMTKSEMQDCLDIMRYYDKNPYLEYEAKIAVVSIKHIRHRWEVLNPCTL